jgi:hypothetical protein
MYRQHWTGTETVWDALRRTKVTLIYRRTIRIPFNECELISRDDTQIYLAGIDDAHFYRANDIQKAETRIPSGTFSILLSHTPEIYDEAAKAKYLESLAAKDGRWAVASLWHGWLHFSRGWNKSIARSTKLSSRNSPADASERQ